MSIAGAAFLEAPGLKLDASPSTISDSELAFNVEIAVKSGVSAVFPVIPVIEPKATSIASTIPFISREIIVFSVSLNVVFLGNESKSFTNFCETLKSTSSYATSSVLSAAGVKSDSPKLLTTVPTEFKSPVKSATSVGFWVKY